MRLLKEISNKIQDKLFGKPYKIEVSTGPSEYSSAVAGTAHFVARPVEYVMVRRFPYSAFGRIVERVSWGTLIIGTWPNPNADEVEFPSYFAAYCRPRHIIECPKLFLERVPGYREHLEQIDPRRIAEPKEKLVCVK